MSPDPIETHLRHFEECDDRRDADDEARLLEERAVAEAVERERALAPHAIVSPERVRLEREVARLSGRLRRPTPGYLLEPHR